MKIHNYKRMRVFDYLFGDSKLKLEINRKYVLTKKYENSDTKPPFENEWLIQVVDLHADEPGIARVKFLSGSKIKGKTKNIQISA
jgi:hypothetical protein